MRRRPPPARSWGRRRSSSPTPTRSSSPTRPTLKAVSAWLDEVKPDIVVTHWPLDTHPNHHAVSSLVWQCYKRKGGWNLYFFEVMTDQQTVAFEPDLYLDIGPVREVKKRALDEHRSQEPEDDLEGPRGDAPPPGGRVRRRVRRGVQAGRGQGGMPAAARQVPCEEGADALCPRRAGSTAPPPSPRPSVIRTASWSTPSDPRTRRGRRRSGCWSPTQPGAGVRLPVVYVLPVEARNESRYGDGLLEVRRHDLHNKFQAIFVAPTFSHLPWYADHPTDPEIRQETLLPEGRRPVHRGPLPGPVRAGRSPAAGVQQVGLGGVQPAAAAPRRVRQGRRLGRPADDGPAGQVRLGRHLRHRRELRGLPDHGSAGASCRRTAARTPG